MVLRTRLETRDVIKMIDSVASLRVSTWALIHNKTYDHVLLAFGTSTKHSVPLFWNLTKRKQIKKDEICCLAINILYLAFESG